MFDLQYQLMLQQQDRLRKDIQRSLARLALVSKQKSASSSIPAYFYSASLLNNYAKQLGADNVNPNYFSSFKALIQQFGKKDFTALTKNNQSVLDQILDIVESEMFIDCLRPDIKEHRHSHEPHQILQATQKALPSLKTTFKNKFSSIEENFINQFDELWERIERAYSQHNIDQAYKLCLEYMDKIGKAQIGSSKQEMLDRITLQYMNMIEYYSQFDKGQWQFDKQQKGIKLQYKVYEQQKMVAIRITGQFDIALDHFLSILSEIDLMGEYVPFCYDCKEIKSISRNQKIGTSKIYIPLLTDRQTYFYAVGYDRQNQTGGFFLYSKTINEDYAFQQRYKYTVPKQSDFVRLEYKFFIVEYVPLTKERAKIRLSSKIDMKMNYLPLFILNKSARIFAFDYFKNILKISKSFKGSMWEKKIAERPALYQFFKRKMIEYFGKQ